MENPRIEESALEHETNEEGVTIHVYSTLTFNYNVCIRDGKTKKHIHINTETMQVVVNE